VGGGGGRGREEEGKHQGHSGRKAAGREFVEGNCGEGSKGERRSRAFKDSGCVQSFKITKMDSGADWMAAQTPFLLTRGPIGLGCRVPPQDLPVYLFILKIILKPSLRRPACRTLVCYIAVSALCMSS